jgi:hypothetical protein
MFVDFHNWGFVAASVAVIWCTKNSYNVFIVGPIEPLHHKLMSACDSRQTIRMIELFWDILPETIPCTSWRNTPSTPIIRVRPEQVADGTLMRYLLNAIELSYLVQCVYAGRETTMEAEDLILNDCSERQKIKQFCVNFPNVRITILSQTLIIKTISKKCQMIISTYVCVIYLLSWFPLRIVSLSR